MKKQALALLIAAAGAASAADPTPLSIKPGLWESTTVTERSGSGMPAIPPEALARMPPEQRAKIEAMAGGKPVTTTNQSCRLEKDLRPFTDSRTNQACKQTIVVSTATRQEMEMDCSNPGGATKGTVTVDAKDSEHVSGLVLMHTNFNGHQVDTKITIAAKWVSADCGNVKPASEK